MSSSILVFSGAAQGLVSSIAASFPVLGPYKPSELEVMTEAERLAVGAYIATSRMDNALVEALPNLGLIACLGSGFEGIDLPFVRARGIQVTHNPNGNASSVAELAVALLLAVERRIVTGDQLVRSGAWPKLWPAARMPYVHGLAGRKVGILGLGSIGARIASRLQGFEVEIGYHNRRPAEAAYRYFETPLALAAWADALVVAVRAGEDNRGLVGREMLDALGPAGVVVNIARGTVMDEAALTEALREGRIAGAGLDVFEREPHVGDELLALPNVVLTPHEGGMTTFATDAGRRLLLQNLKAFFAGAPVLTPVPG